MTGVIFDLDGVLAETEQLWEGAWIEASARRGYRWTPDDTANAQGMSLPEWAGYLATRVGRPEEARQVGDECVDRVVAAIERGDGPLLEGARELVESVSARMPIALASSAARRVIDAVLRHHELAAHFTATVSSEEVPRGKPSPDVYLDAARRIGLAEGDGIAVEDSSNGIRAAHAAGLTVIALPNPTYPPKPDAVELATFVAADHADVKKYVLDVLEGSGTR